MREVAEQMGTPYNRLSNLMHGKIRVTEKDIEGVRKALDLPDYWPGSPPHLGGAVKGQIVSLSGTPLVKIPVAGNVAAGPETWNVDPDMLTVKVPASIAGPDTIGFIVDGDSMMPFLEEFDTAVFRKATRKLNSYIYLLRLPGNGVVVKRVQYDRGDWYLISENDKYPPVLMAPGTEFLGLLVGIYRVRGTREQTIYDANGLLP